MRKNQQIIHNYCVLDLETTGLSSETDTIIEVGILKVRDNAVVDQFVQLVDPGFQVSATITRITGITNAMLKGQPSFEAVSHDVLAFLGDDVVLGHNTQFDVRFLEACFGKRLHNQYMDTLLFSRKLFPELPTHRLGFLADHFDLPKPEHRSLADCFTTKAFYDIVKHTMLTRGLSIADIWVDPFAKNHIKIADIKPDAGITLNPEHIFFGKRFVFTGSLCRLERQAAMQEVVNRGGFVASGISRKVDFLVVGNDKALKPSSKVRRAWELQHEGHPIQLLDEEAFYTFLNS